MDTSNLDYFFGGSAWLFIVFANTAIAAALGRSRLWYFLISLFLGPIATIILAVWGRNAETFPPTR